MEQNGGYVHELGQLVPEERNRSVLRPYGVFGVIAPFNFPVALAAGMSSGGAGRRQHRRAEAVGGGAALGRRARPRLPRRGPAGGRVRPRPRRPGDRAPRSRTATSTGSRSPARPRSAARSARRLAAGPYPRPVLAEMGGKNPAIVTAAADLDKAAEGIARAAFGFSGQKCSACSRAIVAAEVHDELVERLAADRGRVPRRRPGRPRGADRARSRTRRRSSGSSGRSRRRGATARSRAGGEVLGGGGHFVAPTVVSGLPAGHRLTRDELFLPFLTVTRVRDLDEALAEANAVPYGLTAGVFSRGRARGRALPRRDRGGRRLREPARAARRPARGRGSSRSRAGSRAASAARAASARTTCSSSCASRAGRSCRRDVDRAPAEELARADAPRLVTELPGPKARALVERDARVTSPSLPRAYPLVPARGGGLRRRGRRRQPAARLQRGDRRHVDRPRASGRGVEAIRRQAGELLHYSASDFYLPVYVELCERLAALFPGGGPARVFLTNSGTEAVEAAVKLARWHTGRQYVIAFFGAFHGRSYGSASLTASKAKYRARFGPLLPGVLHAPYADSFRPNLGESEWELPDGVVPRGRALRAARRPGRGGGDRRRADPGRGRLRRPAAGLARGAAGAVRPARHPARRRRGAERDRAHGPDVGGRARGRRAGHRGRGQGDRERDAARGDARARGGRDLDAGDARLDIRRQPGRVRGGARDAAARGGTVSPPARRRRGERLLAGLRELASADRGDPRRARRAA